MNAQPDPSTSPTYVQLTALLVKARPCSIVAESIMPEAATVTAEIDAAIAAIAVYKSVKARWETVFSAATALAAIAANKPANARWETMLAASIAASIIADIDAAREALYPSLTSPSHPDHGGWWAIEAKDAVSHYGYGYEDEAMEYADELNKKRVSDRYSYYFLGETDAEATEAAKVPDITTAGFTFNAPKAPKDPKDPTP